MYSEVTSVYVPVTTPDYKGWALLLSVLGHILLVLALVFFYRSPPAPMETTLITPEQLAELQGQIRANQQSNTGEVSGSMSPMQEVSGWLSDVTKTTDTSPSHDSHMAQLKQDMAAKEAAFNKDKAQFDQQLAQQADAEQQQLIEQINTDQVAEQDALQQSHDAERDRDALRQALTEANEAYHKAALPSRSEAANPPSPRSLSLATDGHSPGGGSNAGSSGSRASGTSSAGYLSLIKGRITANWQPPTNSNSKSLRASFNITASGAITNISVSGSSDDAFKDSLIQAIQAASPLPAPPNDDDVKRINITFVAN